MTCCLGNGAGSGQAGRLLSEAHIESLADSIERFGLIHNLAGLLDEDGKVGRAYGARTTPHMYIVDPQGTLVYAGAIDSKPSANPADIPGATNHVKVALAESMAGKPVGTPATRAYGCTVKYGNAGE